MKNHFCVYSHGFGVRKDDRGLFSDIAKAFPDFEHVMFDYNEFDESSNTLIARPLDQQANILSQQIEAVRQEDPEAVIDIIAHSQGCVVASLAKPSKIRRIIFLAPPAQFLGLEKQDINSLRPNTVTDEDGTIHMPRRDGSTTIIKDDYWKSCEGIRPIELYNTLGNLTDLTIITATKDKVLANTDFSGLMESIRIIEQEANHDFTGEYRELLLEQITKVLQND